MEARVEPARLEDRAEFVRLMHELHVNDPAPSTERFAAMLPDLLVVRSSVGLAAYTWARARGDKYHVVHIVTDPAERGRGLGAALMEAVAARARARGLSRWMLNVKPDNLAARALYEKCGMGVALESASLRLPWASVEQLPDAAVPVQIGLHGASDDARFEAPFRLSPGELTALRSLPGRIFLHGEDAAGPTGIAGFDPEFPGTMPFRVRAPEFARSLLAAIRPHARPEHDHVFIFVEGDPASEAALLAAGGEIKFRVLRMEGAIPAAAAAAGSTA
jgi:GNAT superfamily N-acetyltransferase